MSLKAADKFGIIDIGSNTIRSVITKSEESMVLQSHILTDTVSGVLTEKGSERLLSSLLEMKAFFEARKITKIYAFATSAMRDVTNFKEVYDFVKQGSGIEIDLVSEERETEYDFLAIKEKYGKDSGIAVDLGGGSAQVIAFLDGKLTEGRSMPIGAKRIRKQFSKNAVPNENERKNIEEFIDRNMKNITSKSDTVYFMGGTAKAVKKAAAVILGEALISPDVLELLYETVTVSDELLESLFGKRADTMPSGIIVMKRICENTGALKITVTDVGVRDGYQMKIEKEDNNE